MPPVPQTVVFGYCGHTHDVKVNMGQRKPENLGRLFHFVSGLVSGQCVCQLRREQCPVWKRTIFHHPQPHSRDVRDDLRNRLALFDTERNQIRRTSRKVKILQIFWADQMSMYTDREPGGRPLPWPLFRGKMDQLC